MNPDSGFEGRCRVRVQDSVLSRLQGDARRRNCDIKRSWGTPNFKTRIQDKSFDIHEVNFRGLGNQYPPKYEP